MDSRSSEKFDLGAASEYKKNWREYEQVLDEKELHWFQMSRAKWFYVGDQNAKYFNGITTIRMRKNIFEM